MYSYTEISSAGTFLPESLGALGESAAGLALHRTCVKEIFRQHQFVSLR
jgi:hypothetical protein